MEGDRKVNERRPKAGGDAWAQWAEVTMGWEET